MGHKKKGRKKGQQRRQVTAVDGTPIGLPPRTASPKTTKDLLEAFQGPQTEEQIAKREAATQRIKAVMDMLTVRPSPILQQLQDMGIPLTYTDNGKNIVISLSDLAAVDERLANQGTLYDQVWKNSEEKGSKNG